MPPSRPDMRCPGGVRWLRRNTPRVWGPAALVHKFTTVMSGVECSGVSVTAARLTMRELDNHGCSS